MPLPECKVKKNEIDLLQIGKTPRSLSSTLIFKLRDFCYSCTTSYPHEICSGSELNAQSEKQTGALALPLPEVAQDLFLFYFS